MTFANTLIFNNNKASHKTAIHLDSLSHLFIMNHVMHLLLTIVLLFMVVLFIHIWIEMLLLPIHYVLLKWQPILLPH